MSAIAVVGKTVLVLATLVCLASIGGAMLFAFPVLVPLQWLAARRSGPYATGAWALLAGLSMFEAGWMLAYVATDAVMFSMVVGLVVGASTAVTFVRRGMPTVGAPARL